MKKIIFVSGPVRGDGSKEAQHKNMEVAKQYIKLFRENKIPYYSPHLNIDQEIINSGEELTQFSWDMNAEFLLHSDAMAVLPGWENSSGTKEEIENATKMNLPIFYLSKDGIFKEIVEWLNKG